MALPQGGSSWAWSLLGQHACRTCLLLKLCIVIHPRSLMCCMLFGAGRVAALCSPTSKYSLLVWSKCLPCCCAALDLNMFIVAVLAGTWFAQTLSFAKAKLFAADIILTEPNAAVPLRRFCHAASCTTAAAGAVPCLSLPRACLLLIPCLLQHEMNSPAKTGVGTPVYMAPEVILGDNKYDAKVS